MRKRAWRECNYEEGRLREFESEEGFLLFEEERYQQGGALTNFGKSFDKSFDKSSDKLRQSGRPRI